MKSIKTLLSLALVLALAFTAAPAALAESDYAIVTERISVYGNPTLTEKIGSLQQYVVVVVKKSSGDSSLISYCGRTGYVSSDDLDIVDSRGENASVVQKGKVYETPSTSARSATLKKGWTVTVLMVKGSWALIEMGGKTGYTPTSNLSLFASAAPEESDPEYDSFSGKDCADFTVRAVENLPVYSHADTDSPKLGTLASGASITVTAYNGTWAKVHNGRESGYVKITYLMRSDEFSAVTDESTAVYASPVSSSEKLGTLASGVGVTVTAYNPEWSRISWNGKTGYCLNSCLRKGSAPAATPVPTPTPAPTATPAPEKDEPEVPSFSGAVVPDSAAPTVHYSEVSGSGAIYVYNYIRQVMGLNTAAACGIMVNLLRESRYNPASLNSTGHYGICQWGGSRKSNLYAVCEENGLDPETLEGQMFFLHYELRTSYKKTWERLQNVTNSPDGAYQAGYWFCYNFEVPANRESSSISRGTYAAETLFPEYSK